MGRKKSDSPTLFPWDKLFSDDENTFNQGLNYCKSEYSGSETLKRAVTAIGSGYNSGSKPVLCDRIKLKANQIRYQISKVQNASEREELRTRVIDYYTQSFLKKFEGKEPDIVNIAIPARPDLPSLNEQEKRRYSSPPSSPRSSPPSSPRNAPPAFDLDDEEDIPMPPPRAAPRPPREEVVVTDGSLLSARAILYYKNAPFVDGKKKLSAKTFYDQLISLYSGVVSNDSPLLNKESIKAEITQIPAMIKAAGGILKKEVIDKANAVVKKSESMYIREVEIEEEDIPMPPSRVAPIIPPQVVEDVYQSSVTGDEIMNYIKTKGWEEPKYKSKEALCDYVLRKIKTEDVKSENEYKSIEDRIDKLSTNLLTLIEMQEERIKALEKAKADLGSGVKSKSKKKVSFGKDQVKIIENEVEEIQEQIHEVKEQLQEAKDTKEEIVQQQEEKKQMCFRMRTWLDQDEFDRVEAEKDLVCDTGVCNVESGVCETSEDGDYTSTIGIAKIKGSKANVDRMYNQFNKPVITGSYEPDEEEIPMVSIPEMKQKKPKIPAETLREQIKLILSTSDLEKVSAKDIRQQLSMIFKVKFDKRKDEIDAIITEEFKNLRKVEVIEPEESGAYEPEEIPEMEEELPEPEELSLASLSLAPTDKQIVEKTVEFLEEAGKKINEKAVRAKVGEFFNIDITPHKALIKSTVKQFVEDMKGKRKRCNTIPLYQEVDEETRAQDLMCGDGEACNLDESRCDPVEELTEPVEELTIGGMLVKVSGKNKIIEALRQKIIKSGGAIPFEDAQNEVIPVEEIPEEEIPEIGEELPEEDEFKPPIEEPNQLSEPEKPLSEVIEESAQDVFQSNLPGIRINLEDLINNIKSITKKTGITSAQNKIKAAERKCIDRIAKCAGIKL